MSADLDRLARRASAHPSFLGHRLAAYQHRHGLTDADLAAWLGVSPHGLTRLRLCGAVRSGADGERDARDIAAAIGCSEERLREVVGCDVAKLLQIV